MKTNPDFLIARMTLRESFAQAAMQGILSDPTDLEKIPGCTCAQSVAVRSVIHADALIEALNGASYPVQNPTQS